MILFLVWSAAESSGEGGGWVGEAFIYLYESFESNKEKLCVCVCVYVCMCVCVCVCL